MRRTTRGESIGAVIHIFMETAQGDFLYSYLYLKSAKMSCFILYVMLFLLQNQRTGVGNRFFGVHGWHWWEWGGGGERGWWLNLVQTMYACVCKCKNDTF
jgi:hypothetical protein